MFKHQRILQNEDIRLITKYLTYKELNEGDYLWDYGEPAENFYFILRGDVSHLEPNDEIPKWEWARAMYLQL